MCLGVPGQVVRIDESPVGMTMGVVSFAGVTKEVCLAYVPRRRWATTSSSTSASRSRRSTRPHANDIWEALETMGELAGPESPTRADAS